MDKKHYLMIRGELESAVFNFYNVMYHALSDDWKTYEITIGDDKYDFHPATTSDEKIEMAVKKKKVISYLLIDALTKYIEELGEDDDDFYKDPFKIIDRILFSATRKEDHQFEIIREEVVSNLDENGNPVTAKALNQDSVYVQWQNENNYKFEENDEENSCKAIE